jgi:hypothetical protein
VQPAARDPADARVRHAHELEGVVTWAIAAALYGGALPWISWESDDVIPIDVVILGRPIFWMAPALPVTPPSPFLPNPPRVWQNQNGKCKEFAK